jgi:hypothetical protein
MPGVKSCQGDIPVLFQLIIMKFYSKSADFRQKDGLRTLIREIVRIGSPEKIFLLSASYDYQLTENIFIKAPEEEFRGSCYDLMILADGRKYTSLADLGIRMNSFLFRHGNPPVCLRDIHSFNQDLEAGDEYACYILLNALLCYDKESIPLAYPGNRIA